MTTHKKYSQDDDSTAKCCNGLQPNWEKVQIKGGSLSKVTERYTARGWRSWAYKFERKRMNSHLS